MYECFFLPANRGFYFAKIRGFKVTDYRGVGRRHIWYWLKAIIKGGVLSGLVERSAVWLAERSLRREDGRTADTAGMGGWDLKVRTAAVESTVG